MLCAAIWSINPLSGLLVLAALVPTVLAFTLIARMESKDWPTVAEHDRRAAYATEQLIQQPSGTELAVLGSGAKVAERIAGRRAKATHVLDRMVRTAMRLELAAALATVVLFGGALIALVTGRANEGAVGTITGLGAIRGCGYAFGTIITAAPQAAVYRRFVKSAPAQQGKRWFRSFIRLPWTTLASAIRMRPDRRCGTCPSRLGAVSWSRWSG